MKTLPAMLLLLLLAPTAFSGENPLLRRYREGEKLTYHMKVVNEQWHYEIQADGVVKKSADGTYLEEYRWSHFMSDGQMLTPTLAGMNSFQQLTLDPNHPPIVPNLGQVDPRMIGPITDLLTFYVDVWMAVKADKLANAGDHFYVKRGTPASWADGNYTLLGEDSIDFDFTLKEVNGSNGTATLVVRHVPPEKPEVKFPVDWMRKPVAGTPNNWVQVQKTKGGKYLAASGKETFDVHIVLSLSDGKILSVHMDNPVKTVERECTDAALSQCGEPKPHFIRRQVEMSLER